MDLKKYIRSIPDYPKAGILFRDITTLVEHREAFGYAIGELIERSARYQFARVAAIESRGFVFAAPIAYALKKPFVMLRKKDKLPAATHSIDFELEYGTATMEMHQNSVAKGEAVLLVDDLLATGGTALAAANLIEKAGASVAGALFLINLFDLGGADALNRKGYKNESLMEFPGH